MVGIIGAQLKYLKRAPIPQKRFDLISLFSKLQGLLGFLKFLCLLHIIRGKLCWIYTRFLKILFIKPRYLKN